MDQQFYYASRKSSYASNASGCYTVLYSLCIEPYAKLFEGNRNEQLWGLLLKRLNGVCLR
jgi:hypothetical protein